MDIRKAMKIRDNANSEVKLTKSGEKYSKCNEKEIDKLLKKSSDLEKLNLNELLGLSLNPLLSSTNIRSMFKLLKSHNDYERENKVREATRTRNMGVRGKIRKQLALHPNLDSEAIDSLLSNSKLGKPAVLNNPNITKKQLDNYFEKRIISSKGGYNFVAFKELMESNHITSAIALEWYNKLKKYADWTYKDNQWYAIVDGFIEFEDCPYEILKDVMELSPTEDKDDFFNRPLRYRKAILKHKNSKPELEQIAYEKTGLEEFLSQEAKDLFLF